MSMSRYGEQGALAAREIFRSSAARVGDADVELYGLSPDEQHAVSHLTLEPEQEQFAGLLDVVFTELRNSQHPEAEHPFAIVAHDEIVGFFVLREKSAVPVWASQDVVTLHSFRIGRNHQGEGYGRAGVTLAARWTLWYRPNVRQLMLAVNVRNSLARNVYLSCGFIDTGAIHQGPIGDQNILTYDVQRVRTAAELDRY
jgi:RimJ/RimL family protein N-acetyltransferase